MTRRDIDRIDRGNLLRKIGYHWVIRRDGEVEAGRDESEASMHDGASESKCCISVCLVGGVAGDEEPEDNFTFAQRKSLNQLVHEIYLRHPEMQALGWDAVVSKTPSVDTRTLVEWVAE